MEGLQQLGWQARGIGIGGMELHEEWWRSPGIAEKLSTHLKRSANSMEHPGTLLQQRTDGVVGSFSALAEQVVQQVTEQVQTSLVDPTVRRAGDLSSGIVDSLLERSSTTMGSWVNQHPIAGWLLTHPILSAIALVLGVSLVWTLIGLLGRLLQQAWIALLKAPLAIGLWLGGQMMRGVRGAIAPTKPLPAAIQDDRVTAILLRLEHLRQEQDLLMQELKVLLEQTQDERAKEPR